MDKLVNKNNLKSKLADGLTEIGLSQVKAELGEGGTEVVANPEEEATDVLTKIKIDGVVYSVEGGSSELDELMNEEF